MSDRMTNPTLVAFDTSYFDWLKEVRSKFDQPEEFDLAAKIYSFASACEDGLTPAEAYTDFDVWASA